jgi:hypothetical protein
MNARSIAAGLGALLLTSAALYAASPSTPEPGNDEGVVILQVQPQQEGATASPEEVAAMQMLLLQLLMMQQSGEGSGNAQVIAPAATQGVEI